MMTTVSLRIPGPLPAADPAICTRAVRVDPDSGMAIWELREPLTGRILKQYPSARSLAEYRRRFGAVAT